MPEFIKQMLELWNRLKPGQRFAVVAAVVGTLGLMGAMIYYGSQTEYGVLFSDLKTADAQSIVEQLKTANVPYRLTNGGTAVQVPTDRVTDLRLQIAASNRLTGGHVGFDLFDKGSFGATDFSQRVNYQRALEGELARTLEGMDEVETARVHITPPRESVFAEKAEKGKASVVLRMRQNRELARERTEAVVNLIASAAEGIDPADVSVMDSRGRLLTAPSRAGGGATGANAFNSNLEARQKLEAETSARIISLLEPIVGKGHVQADVSADVDFSQVEQTEEKYDPKSAVIRSQQSSAEYRNSANSLISGLVGARGNDPSLRQPSSTPTPTPTPTPANPQQANAQPTPSMPPQQAADQRNAATLNYEIDKTVRRTIGGIGRVTRLSASVLVDHKLVNGNGVARTPEELKKIQDIVAAAIGIDTQRGDQVVVESFSFDKGNNEVAKTGVLDRYREMIAPAIKYGSFVLAALLLVLFVVRPAQKALKAATSPEPKLLAAGTGATADELAGTGNKETAEGLPEARRDGELEGAPPEKTVGQLLNSNTPRTVAELEAAMNSDQQGETTQTTRPPQPLGFEQPLALREQIAELTHREPELVAMTLRGWLQEVE